MSWRTSKRPVGQATRGKTAPNRLRRLDVYLAHEEAALLRRRDGDFDHAVAVDLGFGREPTTTVEMCQRLQAVSSELKVVGVELDRERVQAAQDATTASLTFVHGGFDVKVGAPVRLIRAMNVLRQYDEDQVDQAWRQMGEHLVEGGLLADGTCDPYGKTMVVALLRRHADGLIPESLLFCGSFDEPMAPDRFPPRLPKRWIHRMVPGEHIFDFFAAWRACWQRNQPRKAHGHRDVFSHTVRELASLQPVSAAPWLLRRGYLRYRLKSE